MSPQSCKTELIGGDPDSSTGKSREQAFLLKGGSARLLAVTAVLGLALLVPSFSAQQKSTVTIEGSVHDSAGHNVADASVRLQRPSDGSAQERITNSEGNFLFADLKAGSYVVSAAKGEQHSNEVTVNLSTGGATQHVDLTLASASIASGMEFSDAPNFTVAAVSDWTAAGGHGSDTSLRTSEALTRETLQLRPQAEEQKRAHETEQRLRDARDKSPSSYKSNEELGHYYIEEERYSDAVAPLRTAYEIDPANQDAEYELALALNRSGDAAKAREHVTRLLGSSDKPQWHRLAGEVDEKLGDPLAAVHEFERAVKEDPSEENYFAWGSELLLHRAVWQAKDVFESGVKAHADSERLRTALGASLFAGAMYDEAATRLCEASDLKPADAEPYLFMGKVELASPNPLPCIEQKLARFAELQPSNALATYYYAIGYWKAHGQKTEPETLAKVGGLLKKAVELDPRCSSAYLQLGNLQASQQNYSAAAAYYLKAIESDPQMSDAHYRLGMAYDRLGKKEEAAEQFKLHDELEKQQAAAVDRQRREIKQFIVQIQGKSAASNTQP